MPTSGQKVWPLENVIYVLCFMFYFSGFEGCFLTLIYVIKPFIFVVFNKLIKFVHTKIKNNKTSKQSNEDIKRSLASYKKA